MKANVPANGKSGDGRTKKPIEVPKNGGSIVGIYCHIVQEIPTKINPRTFEGGLKLSVLKKERKKSIKVLKDINVGIITRMPTRSYRLEEPMVIEKNCEYFVLLENSSHFHLTLDIVLTMVSSE